MAPVLSSEAVAALSEQLNEPEWLRERRLRSWLVYQQTPMPTAADEEWRRTDIRKLNPEAFRPAADVLGASTEAAPEASSGSMQIINGRVVDVTLEAAAREQGVLLTSLSEAAASYPELVQRYLATLVTDEYSKFAALANAMGSGIFLYVPANVRVELPINVTFTATEAGSSVFPRTLIVAERFAEVTLIESYESPDFDQESLSVAGVEVFGGEGSQVRYVNIQEWGAGVRHFLVERHSVARDAQNNNLNIAVGGKWSKSNVEARFEGPGARCEMLGLFFASGSEFFDHHTLQDHTAPNCFSDLLYKGVLRDTSRTVFSGLIRVEPGAQKTDAYQTNRNLLLSDAARADSIPNLEIGANDVRCSHGASVGPIDKEQLFYLMARGLSRRDAERMIVDGFLEPIVSRIPLEGVRDRLLAALDRKMQ